MDATGGAPSVDVPPTASSAPSSPPLSRTSSIASSLVAELIFSRFFHVVLLTQAGARVHIPGTQKRKPSPQRRALRGRQQTRAGVHDARAAGGGARTPRSPGNENEPLTALTGFTYPTAEQDDPMPKAVAAFCFPESVVTHATVEKCATSVDVAPPARPRPVLTGRWPRRARGRAGSMANRHVGSFYVFVMTEASGARMYGFCLRRLPKKAEHARERFAECVCFISYQCGRGRAPRAVCCPRPA